MHEGFNHEELADRLKQRDRWILNYNAPLKSASYTMDMILSRQNGIMACLETSSPKKLCSSICNMRVTLTESGKAWEYGLARKFADILNNKSYLVVSKARQKYQESCDLLPADKHHKIDNATSEVACFLRAYDACLLKAEQTGCCTGRRRRHRRRCTRHSG